ncbi:MAG: exopolysaccharide Pel transporter PelG [Methyloligellaceae bacterium]
MAGIGFELRKLSLTGTLSDRMASSAHGAIIATGPWLFTIASLAAITLATHTVVDHETLSTFRVMVFYGFFLSMIVSAPALVTGVRMVADAIYSENIEQIASIFLHCAWYAVLPVTVVAILVYFTLFALPLFAGLMAVATCVLTSLIWVAIAFCSAIRDYKYITVAFTVGMLAAVLDAILMAFLGHGAEGMLAGLNLGLCVIVVILFNRLFLTFPHPIRATPGYATWFIKEMANNWLLCLGTFVAALAIWIDKFILWNSSFAESVSWGLRHAPAYDSALFISFLCIIPALSQYVTHTETRFYEQCQKYYNDISRHSCWKEINKNANEIRTQTVETIFSIFIKHVIVCGVFFIMGPAILKLAGLQYYQLSIYRLGVLGVIFHFLFFACSSIIIFLNRQRIFIRLQIMFLLANGMFTMVCLSLGSNYLGFGYFFACVVCSIVAYFSMLQVLRDINFTTFIANNEL